VAGIWYGIRERQAQHETLRHMIDSGKPIDQALMDKVLGGDRQVHRDLRIGGLIVLCAAPGMALLGWFISRIAEPALMPLLGVATLMVFVGIGLLAASRAAEKASRDGTRSPHV
jgi:cobalamin biosynthesis protein CobD/CbiB